MSTGTYYVYFQPERAGAGKVRLQVPAEEFLKADNFNVILDIINDKAVRQLIDKYGAWIASDEKPKHVRLAIDTRSGIFITARYSPSEYRYTYYVCIMVGGKCAYGSGASLGDAMKRAAQELRGIVARAEALKKVLEDSGVDASKLAGADAYVSAALNLDEAKEVLEVLEASLGQ